MADKSNKLKARRPRGLEDRGPAEIAQWKFTPSTITKTLMDDYTAEVQPKGKQAAA